jgi:MFS family permease
MILAQRYPVERVASILVVLWGICLILTVACTNYQGLYAQRFFLGLLESGISPLFMLIVVSIRNNSSSTTRCSNYF